VFALLAVGIVTGLLATLTNLGDAVHYRDTVAPYFRKVMVLDPEPGLMTGHGVTLVFQIHVVSVWFLYALWPFSRLVHAFSIPVDFLRRSPIPYRGRTARGAPTVRAGR
jgi:nitrate reductase gamma subunit